MFESTQPELRGARRGQVSTRVGRVRAATTLLLATPLTGRRTEVYLTAAILVGIGAALWGVNRLVNGRRVTELDAERLVK